MTPKYPTLLYIKPKSVEFSFRSLNLVLWLEMRISVWLVTELTVPLANDRHKARSIICF